MIQIEFCQHVSSQEMKVQPAGKKH